MARAPVVHPEEEVHEGVEDELQRPVHHGFVLVALTVEQVPGVQGVQAFVVADRPVAQADHTADQGQGQQKEPRQLLAVPAYQAHERKVEQALRLLARRGRCGGGRVNDGLCGRSSNGS